VTNVAEERCITADAAAASLRDLLVANAIRLGRPDRFWVFRPDRADLDGSKCRPLTDGS
jgi:hypothetical protein